MKKQIKNIVAGLFVAVLFSGCAAVSNMGSSAAPAAEKSATSDSGLVSTLTSSLGVSNEQATGGAGAIFGYAKDKLSPADFSKVSESMPEVDSLIKAAPAGESGGGAVGMVSALGAGGGAGAGMGALAGSFSKLGLAPDMLGKFIPIVMQYANNKGGSAVSSLLGGVLQ